MGMREYSASSVLASMAVGERLFVETTKDKYTNVMHQYNPPVSRRPAELKKMRFQTALWTAVKASDVGSVAVLVSVERTK